MKWITTRKCGCDLGAEHKTQLAVNFCFKCKSPIIRSKIDQCTSVEMGYSNDHRCECKEE